MTSVLLANNYHYRRGGAEVVYLQQAELLRERGWQVANFAMQHPDNDPSEWSPWFANEIELGKPYPLGRKLVNAGKIIYSSEAAGKIGDVIARSGASLLHAHNIYHHLSPSILRAASRRSLPVVLTLHDMKLLCPSYQMLSEGRICEACKGGHLYEAVRRRCLKGSLALSSLVAVESSIHRIFGLYRNSVDTFVSPSRFLIDKCVEWGWPRDAFAFVPNFVDASKFAPSLEENGRFLYVGRLSREKGIATLVAAAADAGVAVDVVGSGPDEDRLKALAAESGGNVVFHGFRKGDALWSLIRACRALVLPSEWYENAPISLLEAFAMAKPVIGAAIGGIPEMVTDGVNGMLYPSGDRGELAECLRRMAALSHDDILAMGRRSRAVVETRYSPDAHYEALTSVYRRLGVAL